MITHILAITGKSGLFKLVNRGRNMLIVESLADGKRFPAYAHDKVLSLADIAIYTTGDDKPLYEVFDLLKEKNGGKAVDMKAFADDAAMRSYFGEVLPEFDTDRVYNTDIRKCLQWYNILVNAGITDFLPEKAADESDADKEA